MRTRALWASTLAATLLGCGGNFNKPHLLDSPRVLAIRADPPEPSLGVSTTLSTLLYQPALERVTSQCPSPGPTTYAWSWCPWPISANTDYQCPVSDAELAQLFGALGLPPPPSLDLGTDETATFTNPFPASMLYALCRGDIPTTLGGTPSGQRDAGTGRSIFSCDLPAKDYKTTNASETDPIGFKVTVKVVITPACPGLLPEGFSPLVAIYSLHLPTNDDIPVNQNPVLNGIWATDNWTAVATPGGAPGEPTGPADGEVDAGTSSDDGGADDGGAPPAIDGGVGTPDASQPSVGPPGSVALDDAASVTVKRDKHVGVKLDTDISSAEHLAVPAAIDYDSKNDLTRHYEHLAYTWFVEGGSFPFVNTSGKGGNTGYLPTAWPPGQDNPPTQQDLDSFDYNITNVVDLPRTEDYAYDTARIIVVVRDGRGGVGWTTRQVRLEGSP